MQLVTLPWSEAGSCNRRQPLAATLGKSWNKWSLFDASSLLFLDSLLHCTDSLPVFFFFFFMYPELACSFPQSKTAFRKRFGFIYLYIWWDYNVLSFSSLYTLKALSPTMGWKALLSCVRGSGSVKNQVREILEGWAIDLYWLV